MQKGNVNLLLRTLLIAALAGVFSGARPGGGENMPASQRIAGDKLGWLSVEQAAGKLSQTQRPVLIDLYTTWCGWCKRMDKTTYSNKRVIQYLNDKFYPVRVDAESKEDISWNGRTYHFDAGNKVNEFAIYIAHGQMEFPTTIIIPPGGEPMPIPGYMEPKQLELIVKYFGEGQYGKIPFEEFQKGFKGEW